MLVLGIGLGLVMQVLVIAVQNDVDYSDLGVATSGTTLFRLVGGSLGTAVLGAIFASQLAGNLARLLPAGSASSGAAAHGISSEALAQLSPATRAIYGIAFTSALNTVFLVAAIICALGFVLSWFLPERPLRVTVATAAEEIGNSTGETFGRLSGPGAGVRQLHDALVKLADRDVQREHIGLIIRRAGESLSPLAAWLLVRIERTSLPDALTLARANGISVERVETGVAELSDRGLIRDTKQVAGNELTLALTDAGCDVLDRLTAARRAHFEELSAGWDNGHDEDAAAYLRSVVRELLPDVGRPATLGVVAD
jgi:hypothetical protein